ELNNIESANLRLQALQRWQVRHPPQFRGISPCFRSWCAQAKAAPGAMRRARVCYRWVMSQSGLGVGLIVARPIGSCASLVVALMTLCICTASLALAEDVLYCVDTDLTGFKWDNKGSVRTANFVAQRYTVKVVSDTERLITRMLGDTAGSTDRYH